MLNIENEILKYILEIGYYQLYSGGNEINSLNLINYLV